MIYDYEYFKKEIYSLTTIDLNAYKEKQMKRRIDTLIAKHKIVGYDKYVQATEERQRSAKTIAADADVMIVIGGKHSSNSRKLYEICQRECEHTYFIQTLDDLHLDLPKAVRLVGITAGASARNKLIEEVQNYVRINF